MEIISIRNAEEKDKKIIESIMQNTIAWLEEFEISQWSAQELRWESLSKIFTIQDFHIAYLNGVPAGCMALVDYDHLFWPEVPKGESLFLHKLAVVDWARKSGISRAMIDYFKEQGRVRGVAALQLETDPERPKLRSFYEQHGFQFVKLHAVKTAYRDSVNAYYIYYLREEPH